MIVVAEVGFHGVAGSEYEVLMLEETRFHLTRRVIIGPRKACGGQLTTHVILNYH